ncbi:MAG: protein-L-isoaspartate O-methyltransferase, partial [Candidatus Omnitrophica bacterium]|nr:protein-L-isoaspartate O-methyltransferase [Candidatus Omnitrophota bacterium]
ALYDRIIVTAGSSLIPPRLIEQLRAGGRMVIPIGERFHQDLTIVDKISQDEIKEERVCGCVFVPLAGEYGWD